MPEPVFANIGKLLLATQIYDMHRLAHEVSGGLIVALPGPDEDHNPATAARLADVLRANPAVPYDKRIEVARFIEDLTASYQGGWYSVISLHGGGSPAAMKQEIWRNYPVGNKVELVERLLERGVLVEGDRAITRNRQPGRCCDTGCASRASRSWCPCRPGARAEKRKRARHCSAPGPTPVRLLRHQLHRRAVLIVVALGHEHAEVIRHAARAGDRDQQPVGVVGDAHRSVEHDRLRAGAVSTSRNVPPGTAVESSPEAGIAAL